MELSFLYPWILFIVTISMGVTLLIHIFVVKRAIKSKADKHKKINKSTNSRVLKLIRKVLSSSYYVWLDWSYSFFWILLLVFIIRTFILESFQVPSGSMIPTIKIGDFIIVGKSNYSIHLPFVYKNVMDISPVSRGDVAVFRYPIDENIHFIKRVVGIPGDKITYDGFDMTINGQAIDKTYISTNGNYDQYRVDFPDGVSFKIQHDRHRSARGEVMSWDIPEGSYLMIGDNRDNSLDGRYWGLVAENKIEGKALWIWMNWDEFFSIPDFSVASSIK